MITHTWRGKGQDLTYASHRGVPAQCHEIVLFHPGTRFQVSRVCVKRQRSNFLKEHASDSSQRVAITRTSTQTQKQIKKITHHNSKEHTHQHSKKQKHRNTEIQRYTLFKSFFTLATRDIELSLQFARPLRHFLVLVLQNHLAMSQRRLYGQGVCVCVCVCACVCV